MDVSVSYYTSVGGRSNNEDAMILAEGGNGLLAIVADGLGGENSGEIASQIAVHQLSNNVLIAEVNENVMKTAVENANQNIRRKQLEMDSKMKTTIAALWFNNERAIVAHVGDTRIYQFRKSKIVYQSIDHSVSQMAVMVGEITQDELRGHIDRNRLLRALGASEKVKPDVRSLSLLPGDAFLVCTDGFWELILEDEMLEDLENSSIANQWLANMRKRIENRISTKGDNHTAVAIIINC